MGGYQNSQVLRNYCKTRLGRLLALSIIILLSSWSFLVGFVAAITYLVMVNSIAHTMRLLNHTEQPIPRPVSESLDENATYETYGSHRYDDMHPIDTISLEHALLPQLTRSNTYSYSSTLSVMPGKTK